MANRRLMLLWPKFEILGEKPTGSDLTNEWGKTHESKQFREIRIKRNPDCPLCGEHPTITELFEDGNVGPSCALPGQQ